MGLRKKPRPNESLCKNQESKGFNELAVEWSGTPGGSFMPKMRAVQVAKAGGPLEMVELEIPEPESGAVRIKVQACGVCHSDSVTKDGLFPGIQYPRVPGHEVIGIIDAVGSNVPRWKVGERVGVGWNGGYCGYCDSCRRGNFFACETSTLVTGLTRDGGYAEFMVAPYTALASVPETLSSVEGAPLMCAGVTTFNCLRNSGARPGDVVAVIGLGGLGHLGIQYAAKSGFNTVAIGRGQDKEALATKLGASHYIDNGLQDPAAELQKLGGAKVILATVTSADAMKAVIGGLTPTGTFMIVGAVPSLEVPALQLLLKSQQVKGWYSGTSLDSQDTLAFSVLSGVRSMNESYPLERASEAYERMISGKARFRVVLNMEK
jgi:D-arabinose 1-dehydrogenase-like Zn-dependent alcohol dehydrogenase